MGRTLFSIRTYDSDIEPDYTTSIVARQRRLPSSPGKRLGKVAGGQVAIGLEFERRLDFGAHRLSERTTRMKVTPTGRVERCRDLAGQRTHASSRGGIDRRDAVEQRAR